MALYSQNVLAYDENEVNLLRVSGEEYAYQFLMNKIRNIEITPAQLALGPVYGELCRDEREDWRGAGTGILSKL